MLISGRHAGFTIIELTIVLAIMALLMAIGMPGFKEWIENTHIRSAAESVQSGMNLARAEAVRRNTAIELRLDAGTTTGWVVGCPIVVPPVATCPEVIQVRTSADGSSSRTMVTVSGTGDTDRIFRFNNLGRMTKPVPNAGTSVNVDLDTTSLVAARSRDLRLIVDIGGGVRMCDPSVSTAGDPRKC